jgi:hypothetical protein
MDAKLSEEERELQEEGIKRQKLEEEGRREEEESKKEQVETHRVEKAATAAAEIQEGTVKEGDISEDIERLLKLDLRRLTRSVERMEFDSNQEAPLDPCRSTWVTLVTLWHQMKGSEIFKTVQICLV